MQTTFALAALVAVAYAAPQGVTQDISPPGQPLCNPTFSGEFQIQAVKPATKRDLIERASTCGSPGSLTLKLANGKLTDGQGRVGYIAANFQFQFDAPPQTGAIFTDGFSACSNTSLALGSSAVFYQCLSGNFFNLYDRSRAAQCEPVLLQILPCSSSTPSNGVGQSADGQPTGTAVGPVSQISDGQPQGQSAVPITELTDGQPQVPTVVPKPITQISDGQVQAPTRTAAPISQISDGQVQAPTRTAAPISQISDGQVQAPTSTAVPITQISDGQVQAPTSTAVPITQISDGQVQAPTRTVAPITQISDGQIQAPTSTAAPITQISDGQIQAPGNATTTATPVPFTGAGNSFGIASGFAAVVMGLVSVLLL